MKPDWPVKKLGEVAEVYSGAWGSADNAGTPVLRSTNFNSNGTISWNEIAYRSIPQKKVENLALSEGEILLEKSGGAPKQPVGRVVYFEAENKDKVVFGNFISKLKIKDNEVEPKFLFYFLFYLYKIGGTEKYQNQTTGIRNLRLKEYLNLKVPKLNKEVQKKIVEKLDGIRKTQELNEHQISKTEELFNSVLNIVVDTKYQTIRLKEVCKINPDKKEILVKPDNYEVGFLTMADVSNASEILNRNIKKLAEVKKGYTFFKDGDVLFAKITPCMENGKGAFVEKMKNSVGFGSTEFYVLRTIPNNLINKFLYYLVSNKNFRKITSNYMTGSAGQQRVPIDYLHNLKIPIPTIHEQQKIVEKLETVQEYKKKLLKQKVLLRELFDSVLDRCMKGEL